MNAKSPEDDPIDIKELSLPDIEKEAPLDVVVIVPIEV